MPRVRFYNEYAGNEKHVVDSDADEITLGRNQHATVVLDGPMVPDIAATIRLNGDGFEIEPSPGSRVRQDGVLLNADQPTPLRPGCELRIDPFVLEFEPGATQRTIVADTDDRRFYDLVSSTHAAILDAQQQHVDMLELEDEIQTLVEADERFDDKLIRHAAQRCIRDTVLISLVPPQTGQTEPYMVLHSSVALHESARQKIAQHLIDKLRLESSESLTDSVARLDNRFRTRWTEIAPTLHNDQLRYFAHSSIKSEIKNTIFGRGPLELLWRVPDISEIMVVRHDLIYVEINGRLERSGQEFISNRAAVDVMCQLMNSAGRQINNRDLIGDARTTTGDRINAVMPNIALSGPSLTVRKFPESRLKMDDLVTRYDALSTGVAEVLRAAVVARKNILVSGGTGTGKTTFLNCLADNIPHGDRIVTIEDTAELQLPHEHVVTMQTVAKNAEERSLEFDIRRLVKNSLRMRPDRIVVGECRGGEALDMLQAMNTGHDGSMTTIHANSPVEAVCRLEVLAQQVADVNLPPDAIQQQIADAIHMVIHLERRHGRRLVTHVSEFEGIDPVTRRVSVRDIFVRHPSSSGGFGPLVGTGLLPTFMSELILEGGLDLQSVLEQTGASQPQEANS